MNTISKLSAAGALALGFGVAHASILDTNSGGDILLFAEVLNSSNAVIGSYAGDSGIQVGSALSAGSVGNLTTTKDTNLKSLLALATGTNTLEWAVIGGKTTTPTTFTTTDQYDVTAPTTNGPAQLALRTGTNVTNWSSGLNQTINTIDFSITSPHSIFGTTLASGGEFDTSSAVNVANLYGQGTATAETGLNVGTELYHVGMGAGQTSPIVLSKVGLVTLTASGLTFAANSGGGTTVPLPAAVWLLGSGLLGLFGVGRRKQAQAAV